MMEKSDFFSKIIDMIKKDMVHPSTYPSQERIEQYREMFGDHFEMPFNHNYESIQNYTKDNFIKRIFSANKWIEPFRDIIEIHFVQTNKGNVKNLAFKSSSLIIFDSFTMGFIWSMNKALYYGMKLPENDWHRLLVGVILHYSTVLKPPQLNLITPRPKLPRHQNIGMFFYISVVTQIQEMFLLCHEIAHTVNDVVSEIDKDVITNGRIKFDILDDPMFGKGKISEDILEKELMADLIAYNMVLNVYDNDDSIFKNLGGTHDKYYTISASIFSIIRYYMWANLVIQEENEEANVDFYLWIHRNAHIREVINAKHEGRYNLAIISVLEFLENTLELAAYDAKKVYEELKFFNKIKFP